MLVDSESKCSSKITSFSHFTACLLTVVTDVLHGFGAEELMEIKRMKIKQVE